MKCAKGFVRLLAFTLVVGAFLAAGCARKTPTTYKIGAVLPLTGPAAAMGEAARNGIELAVEDINARPGPRRMQIDLRVQDGKNDPTSSVSAFMKLHSEGARFCVTFGSGVALALLPVAERNQVLLLADAAHPDITGKSVYVLRHSNTASQEARLLARFSVDRLKASRLAVLWVNDEFGHAFDRQLNAQLKSAGGQVEVVGNISFEKTEADFRTHAQKAIASRPDAIIVVGYGKALGIAVKRLREYRFAGPILANLGFVLTPDTIPAAGVAAKGVYHVAFHFDEKSSEYSALVQRYASRFSGRMPAWAIIEYNTMRLLAEGLERGEGSVQGVRKAILDLGAFRGVGERMSIQPTGDILPSLSIQRYNG